MDEWMSGQGVLPAASDALGFDRGDEGEEFVFDLVVQLVDRLEIRVGDELDAP